MQEEASMHTEQFITEPTNLKAVSLALVVLN
jgi:hypothetical protein